MTTNPPTFTLQDSAGLDTFLKQMDTYYKPIAQTMPTFDTSGNNNTPDVIKVENLANQIRSQNSLNTDTWLEYQGVLKQSVTFSGPSLVANISYLPHPPLYFTVDTTQFYACYDAWV